MKSKVKDVVGSIFFDVVNSGELVDIPLERHATAVPVWEWVKVDGRNVKMLAAVQIHQAVGTVPMHSLLKKYVDAGLSVVSVFTEDMDERGMIWQGVTAKLAKFDLYAVADPKEAGGSMRIIFGSLEQWRSVGFDLEQLREKSLKIFKLIRPPMRGHAYSATGTVRKHVRILVVDKMTHKFVLDGTEYTVPVHDGPMYSDVAMFIRKDEYNDKGEKTGDKITKEITECQIRLPYHGFGKGLLVNCPEMKRILCEMHGYDHKKIHIVTTMDNIKGYGVKAGSILHVPYTDIKLLKFKERNGQSSLSNQAVVYRDWSKIQSLLHERLDAQRAEGQTIPEFVYDVLHKKDAEALEYLTIGPGASETAIEDNTSHIVKTLCFAMYKADRWVFPSYQSQWAQVNALMSSVYKDRCLKVRLSDFNFYVAYDHRLTGNQCSMPKLSEFCNDESEFVQSFFDDEGNQVQYLNSERAPFVSTFSISDLDPFYEDEYGVRVRYNNTRYTIFISPEFFPGFWMDGDGDLIMVWKSKTSFPYVQMKPFEDIKTVKSEDVSLHQSLNNQMAAAVEAGKLIAQLDMIGRYTAVVRRIIENPMTDAESAESGWYREVKAIKATKWYGGTDQQSIDQEMTYKFLGSKLHDEDTKYCGAGGYTLPKVKNQHLLHVLARKDAGVRITETFRDRSWDRKPMDHELMAHIPPRIKKAREQALYQEWPWREVLDVLGDIEHTGPCHNDSGVLKLFFDELWVKMQAEAPRDLRLKISEVGDNIRKHYANMDKLARTLAKAPTQAGSRYGRNWLSRPYVERLEQVNSDVEAGILLIDPASGTYENLEVLIHGKISTASKSRRYSVIRQQIEDYVESQVSKYDDPEVKLGWINILAIYLGHMSFGSKDGKSMPGSCYWFMPDEIIIKHAHQFSHHNHEKHGHPLNPWVAKYSDPEILLALRVEQERRNAKRAARRARAQEDEDEAVEYDVDYGD